ncbi:hypothetical protein QR680_005437 [Steinernema hermaphroditum]|uniref:G-protein coupled receptors family 1 profile domain-containing protein n=1 Tax=Steinernema hermaphroditum TaxID=289476 RepID=A0AA39HUC9_9BILA|nr:hypothetical protein QR680_005437 [Steinernema hermaphroditum]
MSAPPNATALLLSGPENATDPDAWKRAAIRIISTHVFLVQFLLGFGGNALNLLVLLSKKMRSRTNILFAAMAVADLTFLVFHLFTYFYFAGYFTRRSLASSWYFSYNIYITAFSNWFSAVSIWLMLAVTIERVTVIRRPFQSSNRLLSVNFFVTIAVIFIFTFGITFVQPFLVKTVIVNNRYVRQNNNPSLATAWTVFHALGVVVLPFIISLILNFLLVIALRQQTFLAGLILTEGDKRKSQQPLISSRNRTEKKVTRMVVLILSTFLVLNGPGALVQVLRAFDIKFKSDVNNQLLYVAMNCFAVTGKVLNFILFCLSSSHFRNRLIVHLRGCVPPLRRVPSGPSRNSKSNAVSLTVLTTVAQNLDRVNNNRPHSRLQKFASDTPDRSKKRSHVEMRDFSNSEFRDIVLIAKHRAHRASSATDV